MSVEGIIDRIISDAEAEAKNIIDRAEHEAKSILEKGKKRAEEYFDLQRKKLDEKYRREKERRILNRRLERRKNMLQARQKWMNEAFTTAYRNLIDQQSGDYKTLIITLIDRVSVSKDEEIVFGSKGDEALIDGIVKTLNSAKNSKFTRAEKRGEFPWGFVLRKGKVEINMSIDSLFKYKRTDLEKEVWGLFNADI
jgi:V/A-type H+-transporting ATPase subunit E